MISTNTTDRLSKKRRALTAVRTDLSPAAVKDISRLVEFTKQGRFIGQLSVDPAAGAAFGIAVAPSDR